MTSASHELVRVGVVFETQGFRPVWFGMGSQKVKITEIHYSWTERNADEFFFIFIVGDGVTLFKLTLNSRKMQWEVSEMAQ